MTICLLTHGYEMGGGVPRVVDFLGDGLEAAGVRVGVVSLNTRVRDGASVGLVGSGRRRGRPEVRGEVRPDGRRYTHVGTWFPEIPGQRYRGHRGLGEALSGSELVQVVAGSPMWGYAARGFAGPKFLQFATLVKLERVALLRGMEPGKRWIWRIINEIDSYYERRAVARMEAVFVENEGMARFCRRFLPADRVIYAPPGIDTGRFAPGGVREPGLVVYVGRLGDHRKNLPLLLRALARLQRAGVPVHGRLLGKGPVGAGLREMAASLGLGTAVEFRENPTDEEMIGHLRRAEAFALPSDEEGLGLSVLEAMACGVPVVATRCGGPEEFLVDGVNGFLVNRDAEEEMADRLGRLLREAACRETIGPAGRATVLRDYSQAGNIPRFVEQYRRFGAWDSPLPTAPSVP